MRAVRRICTAVVGLGLLGGGLPGNAFSLTLSDELRVCECESYTNWTSLEVPWRNWTGRAWFGEAEFETAFSTPIGDMPIAYGADLRADITEVVRVEGRYGWYDGVEGRDARLRDKTCLLAPASWDCRIYTADWVRPAPGKQRSDGGTGEIALLLYRSQIGEEGGAFSVRVSAGGTVLNHDVPEYWGDDRALEETSYHGEMTVRLFGTSLRLVHRQHRYEGDSVARREVRGVLDRTAGGPWGVFAGLPGHEYSLFLEEYLGNDVTVFGRGSYVRVRWPDGLARAHAVEFSRVFWGRVRGKLGQLWTREHKATTRHTTLGLSLRF